MMALLKSPALRGMIRWADTDPPPALERICMSDRKQNAQVKVERKCLKRDARCAATKCKAVTRTAATCIMQADAHQDFTYLHFGQKLSRSPVHRQRTRCSAEPRKELRAGPANLQSSGEKMIM